MTTPSPEGHDRPQNDLFALGGDGIVYLGTHLPSRRPNMKTMRTGPAARFSTRPAAAVSCRTRSRGRMDGMRVAAGISMQRRLRLRFTLTDVSLSDAIDVLGNRSDGERSAVGWDLLMTELERRQDGGPGKDVRMPSRVFDKLPSAVREILRERISVDSRRAA